MSIFLQATFCDPKSKMAANEILNGCNSECMIATVVILICNQVFGMKDYDGTTVLSNGYNNKINKMASNKIQNGRHEHFQ